MADHAKAEADALTLLSTGEFRTVEAGPPKHTIGGEPIGPDNPGEYGRTHDFKCPGCEGTSFTASPRSESYWCS